MQVLRCLAFCSFLATLLVALPVNAQLVQVPELPGFGNQGATIPFGSFSSVRYQQIYAASAFPHGGVIDKIMFRNDETLGGNYSNATFDVQVAFAHAATTVHTVSSNFFDNIGSDFTVVSVGVITKSFTGPLGQSSFDFVLDVANTFTYDPTRGDLLLQMVVLNSHTPVILDSSFNPEQFVTTRIYAASLGEVNGTIGGMPTNQRTYGLVTQFEFIQVPEPTTIAQFGVLVLLVGVRRRGRQ